MINLFSEFSLRQARERTKARALMFNATLLGGLSPGAPPPPSTAGAWTTDGRFRVFKQPSLALTGALQSFGAGIPVLKGMPAVRVRWNLYFTGAGGAVTGVQVRVNVPAVTTGTIVFFRGMGGSPTLIEDNQAGGATSVAFITFDISAKPVGPCITVEAFVSNITADGIIDVQCLNAGAGAYSLSFFTIEAYLG